MKGTRTVLGLVLLWGIVAGWTVGRVVGQSEPDAKSPPAAPAPEGRADLKSVPQVGTAGGGAGVSVARPQPLDDADREPRRPEPSAPQEPVATAEPTGTPVAGGRQEPAVSLEWTGPATINIGMPATYQIVCKNISAGAVQQVVVRTRVPNGIKVTGSEPRATEEENLMVWNLGTIQPHQERRIDVHVVPENRGDIACQAWVTFTGSSVTRFMVREPKLSIKTSVPDKILLGDPAEVTLTVSNPGDGQAEHVKIAATLPEGLEHKRGRTVEFDVGTLAPNEARSVQLVCHTKAAGDHKCEVAATADGDLSARETTNLDVIQPRLELDATGPKLRYLDRPAPYVFKVSNPGTATATNVTITDQIPPAFRFVSATEGGRYDANTRTVTWFLGELPAGQNREVKLDMVAINTGEHHHKATALAARGLKAEAEVMTRVEGVSALLIEIADVDDPVEVGADTTYEIRVTNTGSKTATNVQLICTIPDKMEFRNAQGVNGAKYRVEGPDVVFDPLAKLAPRADGIYRVNVRGLGAGDLRFRARVACDGASEPVSKEETTKVYGDDDSHRQ